MLDISDIHGWQVLISQNVVQFFNIEASILCAISEGLKIWFHRYVFHWEPMGNTICAVCDKIRYIFAPGIRLCCAAFPLAACQINCVCLPMNPCLVIGNIQDIFIFFFLEFIMFQFCMMFSGTSHTEAFLHDRNRAMTWSESPDTHILSESVLISQYW